MASKSASEVLLSSMEDVLGVEAVQYFVWSASNNVLSEFTASCGDLRQGVQEGLCKIVEWFDLTYAIYWQVSTSKSGKSALIWGAGHCRVAEGSSNDVNGGKDQRFFEGEQRKKALHKLQACFGGSGDDDMNSDLDFISELEMFYYTSKYFAFPSDKPSSPYQAFDSGKAIWVSDPKCFSEHYQSRAYLATTVQLQTVAFIPMKSGVVEIGSTKYLGKDMKIIDIVKDIFGSNLMQPKTFPRIFGQELCLGGAKSGADSEDHNLIEMARNILKSDYAKENMFSNDIVQDLSLARAKPGSDSEDHNLIEMARNILKSDSEEDNMLSNDIVHDLSLGRAKSGSINTLSSCNMKHYYSLEAKRQRFKERRKYMRKIEIPANMNNLNDIPPDEYAWRKYGQKSVKGSPYPRFGDSDKDDAASCIDSNNYLSVPRGSGKSPSVRGNMICRTCKAKEVSILLLPCRHLCLCKYCEGLVNVCPVCRLMINATVQVDLA